RRAGDRAAARYPRPPRSGAAKREFRSSRSRSRSGLSGECLAHFRQAECRPLHSQGSRFEQIPPQQMRDRKICAGLCKSIRTHYQSTHCQPPEYNGSSENARFESACGGSRSEEHTSELQSRGHLVCRLLLEKKKKNYERPELIDASRR